MKILYVIVGLIELIIRCIVFIIGTCTIIPLVLWFFDGKIYKILSPILWEKL